MTTISLDDLDFDPLTMPPMPECNPPKKEEDEHPPQFTSSTDSSSSIFDCDKYDIHQWSMWKATERGTISRGGRNVGRYLYQERTCTCCGKIELNKVEISTD